MNLDNREFIARHHKGAQSEAQQSASKRSNSTWVLIILLACLYFGFLIFMASLSFMNETAMIATFFGVVASLVGLVIYRTFTHHTRQEQHLDIIQEVLEGSRGARLITDGADNTIYTNQRFDDLCKGSARRAIKA